MIDAGCEKTTIHLRPQCEVHGASRRRSGPARPVSARRFDAKCGEHPLEELPRSPGVYEWLGPDGQTLYVGKAKNLRNRLRQYRNVSRRKAHRKMRALVAAASELRVRTCESDLAALLLENELIQRLRPPFNVSGAFTCLYPCIGLRVHALELDLCCTTSPSALEAFAFFGAYRSPRVTREAFGSLVELLEHLGHLEPTRRLRDLPLVPFTRLVRFRQLDATWLTALEQFFLGTSPQLLERLVLALVEKPAARRHAGEIQAALKLLKRFWDEESEPLRQAMVAAGRGSDRFVPQTERDPLFLKVRSRAVRTGQASESPCGAGSENGRSVNQPS